MANGFNRRDFLKAAAGAGLAAMMPSLGRGASPTASRPNIIVILCDDMGFSDIGCYGSEIPTPNLDRLAANGLRFTHFYNTARCCPTRASLLTGLYPHQASIGHMVDKHPGLDAYTGDLSRNALTMAEAMKLAGYGTYAVGKWHVTPLKIQDSTTGENDKHNWPLQRGFDHYYGIIGGAANYYDPGSLVRDNTPIKADSDTEYKPESYYFTDAIADHAVRFTSDHAKQKAGQPFFMYVAFTAAHWPLHAPESEIAKFKGKYDGGYEAIRKARFERERQMGLINKDWDLSPQALDWANEKDKAWEARCMEVYAAQISRMDQGVGKLVESLKQNNQLDNTLILFLQDNGACAETVGRPMARKQNPPTMPGPKETWIAYGEGWANVSNTPFRYYKHFVHEGGISTPLIAHWPAQISRKGELEQQPGHLIDIMATCVDLGGVKYPETVGDRRIQPLEGVSLAPAFAGKQLARTNFLFWEHEGNRAIRDGKWKLVAKGPEGAWELYDIEADRTEMHDLASQMPDRVKAMTAQWEAFARRTHAIPWPYGGAYGDGAPKAAQGGKKKKKGKKKANAAQQG